MIFAPILCAATWGHACDCSLARLHISVAKQPLSDRRLLSESFPRLAGTHNAVEQQGSVARSPGRCPTQKKTIPQRRTSACLRMRPKLLNKLESLRPQLTRLRLTLTGPQKAKDPTTRSLLARMRQRLGPPIFPHSLRIQLVLIFLSLISRVS